MTAFSYPDPNVPNWYLLYLEVIVREGELQLEANREEWILVEMWNLLSTSRDWILKEIVW